MKYRHFSFSGQKFENSKNAQNFEKFKKTTQNFEKFEKPLKISKILSLAKNEKPL